MLATRSTWLAVTRFAVLSCFVPVVYFVFLLFPPKVELPVKVFSSRSVLQGQLHGRQEMFGHL